MKLFVTSIILAMSVLHVGAAFQSNPLTTNTTPAALVVITNIAKSVSASQVPANVVTNKQPHIQFDGTSIASDGSGGLTATLFQTPGGSVVISGSGVTLTGGPFFTGDGEGITGLDVSQVGGALNSTATNHITQFDTNVVTRIAVGTGLQTSSSTNAAGITVTMTATGTNNVNITNLNSTAIALAGGLTTNNYSTYADVAGAGAAAALSATNSGGIVFKDNQRFNMALTNANAFDAAGLATAATNSGALRRIDVTLIGTLLLSSNMTSTFTTNGSGVVTATVGSVGQQGVFQPASGNLTNWSNLSTNTVFFGSNVVTTLIPGSGIQLTAATNAGNVSVTIAATNTIPNLSGVQPASQNLTNWSGVNTNQIIQSTNLVSTIIAGASITVTATTNKNGITYTVNSTATTSPIRAGIFTATAGGSGTVNFTSSLPTSAVVTIAQSGWTVGSSSTFFDNEVIITGTGTGSFTWSNARGVNNVLCYYIATTSQ